MVVVVIIGLLSTVATVNVLRSRVTANETVTLANIRQLAVGLQAYQSANTVYPNPLGQLSDTDPAYVSASLTGGSGANGGSNVVGYNYAYQEQGAYDYTLIARPATQGVTGVRRFYIDDSGIIRYTVDGSDPTATSPAIQ